VSHALASFVPAALVEERIQEAIRRGDFDNLPGAGHPLELDDDALVPPEVRIGYRILKNAGLVPPELLERREIAELEFSLGGLADVEERKRALAKLAVLRTRLGAHRGGGLVRNAQYARRIVEKWIVESPAGG
jgi:hypothetical protein